VVVGTSADAAALAERIRRDARHVCTIVGFARASEAPSASDAVPGEDIVGTLADLRALTNRYDLRTVVLATGDLSRADALRLAVDAERLGLRVLQAPYGWGVVSPRIGVARVGSVDLVDLGGVRYGSWAERAKRAFDVGSVLLGGALLLPVLAALALAVRLQDGGPALYASRRIGRGGRAFDFYKFRSMVVDAEARREALAAHNEADGRLFKMRDDPRVTPLGSWLRRTSLDELPQLWNVLRGDMHLVGPRPLPERDLVGIEDDPEMRYWFELRHRVNPGITGLWQVSGRSDTGFAEMVRHDLRYIEDWSFWLDLKVLAKTLPAVLRGRGAR
jgi:exopolysaccharide biosynthesis polyprenyl glycosylphosphotransferase